MEIRSPEDNLSDRSASSATPSPSDLAAAPAASRLRPPRPLGEHQLSIPFLFALVWVGCSPWKPRAVYSSETTPPCAAAGLNRAPIPMPKPTSGLRMHLSCPTAKMGPKPSPAAPVPPSPATRRREQGRRRCPAAAPRTQLPCAVRSGTGAQD